MHANLSTPAQFLPLCAAKTRAIHGQCTKDVLQFLMDVLKYSDNRLNKVRMFVCTYVYRCTYMQYESAVCL